MTRSIDRREKLFKLFSTNLEMVKATGALRIEPDLEDIYLCPICLKAYNMDSVHPENGLTLEHVPPASFGGKAMILTCDDCNSGLGHNVDGHLLKKYSWKDAMRLEANKEVKAKFSFDNQNMNGVIVRKSSGEWIINLNKRISHPAESDKFLKMLKDQKIDPIQMTIRPNSLRYNEHKANVALLKSAYLWAFANFGYGFFVNSSLKIVRNQILNPSLYLIQTFQIYSNFSSKSEGLYIVTNPQELVSFLVVMNLTLSNKRKKTVGIVLPGLCPEGQRVYDFMQKRENEEKTGKYMIDFAHVSSPDLLDSKELFRLHEIWNKLFPK